MCKWIQGIPDVHRLPELLFHSKDVAEVVCWLANEIVHFNQGYLQINNETMMEARCLS